MNEINGTEHFGTLLRRLRQKRGLGVNQLAGYVGISGAEISRIERGERKKIDPNLLKKLAPKLDVTYEYLMMHAGFLPNKIAEPEAEYSSSNDILADLSLEDKEFVLSLIKRLKKK